jgi:hypothetical protein
LIERYGWRCISKKRILSPPLLAPNVQGPVYLLVIPDRNRYWDNAVKTFRNISGNGLPATAVKKVAPAYGSHQPDDRLFAWIAEPGLDIKSPVLTFLTADAG